MNAYTTSAQWLRRWGAPPLLGVLSVLGFAPFNLFPLAILAVAGLFHGCRRDAEYLFARGYLFGMGWFLAGVSWIYVSLRIGQLPGPVAVAALLAFAALLAVFPALAIWLTARLDVPERPRWLVLAPLLWALTEWLRGWLFTGFPWQALGYSQAPYSPLAGYAPLLGVYGVSWLAALAAAGLSLRWRPGWGVVALLLLLGHGLKAVDWSSPEGPPVSVSLVQGNIAQEAKFLPEKLKETLEMYRNKVIDSTTRLVILPETAFPVFIEDLPGWFLEEMADAMRPRGGDLVTGIAETGPGEQYYNSMVSLGSSPRQHFHKAHLVPFGEFVPLGFRWFVDMMHIPLGDFARGGHDQAPMRVAGQRLAVNICYEDVFGEELIHALPTATLMVNASNDAWFGDSLAPWQHLQIGQMRALETGRVWLKVNNTGITAIVDEKGRVVKRLEPFTQGVLVGSVQGRAGLTPYARWGNLAFLSIALLGLLGVALTERVRRHKLDRSRPDRG